jgi:hypothetical protein
VIQPLLTRKTNIGFFGCIKSNTNADGSLDRYKVRLVAQGFTQQAGVDFVDTFYPVANSPQ